MFLDQCLEVVFVIKNLLEVLLHRCDHPLVLLVTLLVCFVLLAYRLECVLDL